MSLQGTNLPLGVAFYKDKVPCWQIPDRAIIVDALPLGATGKVLKRKLREQYGEILIES
jgi:acyl-CoA synthetase (AMP-forming)/AMP-acid ligase II